MGTIHDYGRRSDIHYENGTKSVGATASVDLATVTVSGPVTLMVVAVGASFKGTSLLSQSRGFLVEARTSSTEEIARAANDTNTPRAVTGLVFEHSQAEDVTIAVVGFHGDSVSHDMNGYLTIREL